MATQRSIPSAKRRCSPIDEVMIGAPRTMPMLATRSQSHDDLHFAASLDHGSPACLAHRRLGKYVDTPAEAERVSH